MCYPYKLSWINIKNKIKPLGYKIKTINFINHNSSNICYINNLTDKTKEKRHSADKGFPFSTFLTYIPCLFPCINANNQVSVKPSTPSLVDSATHFHNIKFYSALFPYSYFQRSTTVNEASIFRRRKISI